MKRMMATVLTIALAAAACSSATTSDETSPGGSVASTNDVVETTTPTIDPIEVTQPIYESLQLETPEQAVTSLIAAYDDRDFVRVWFMFDEHAKQRLNRALNNLDFSEFRRAPRLLPPNVIEGDGEHADLNNLAMIARFFDDAARLGHLHLDLAGAQIESSPSADTNADESSSAAVTVRLSDQSEARLWLTSSPTNRWRVHQVALDGVDFIEDGRVFIDATCGEERVQVHPGAECPSTETTDWATNTEVAAEVDRLRNEAGDDLGDQIANAQAIHELIAGVTEESDQRICAALQGSVVLDDSAVDEQLLARAETLLAETCPGSIDLLTNSSEAPPSGGQVGERTVYGRLDLTTPVNAVQTFGELFTNEAFVLLFFTFDTRAQRTLTRAINNLDATTIVDERVLETWTGVDSEAHSQTFVGNFASLMTEATANNLHLLDLSGPFDVVSTSQMQWAEERADPVEAQVVKAHSPALAANVHFLMLESPSGRWRVRQVALDPAAFESADNARKVFIAP